MADELRREAPGRRPLVAVVVVHWHGRERTLRCIASVGRLDYPNLRLVLVDNGRGDFSSEEVAALVPSALCVRNTRNLGFAGGANAGMREALALGADYVWFLNSDAEAEPASLAELVAAAEGPPAAAIVGAKVLRLNDPRRIDSVALRIDLRSGRLYLLGHDEIDRGQHDHLSAVTAVTGCAMLVSRNACRQLGGFDESFFAYLEDADLCLRACARGDRVLVAPRARVLHDRASALEGRQSAASLYYAARNHLTLIERHAGGKAWVRRARLVFVALLNLGYAIRPGSGSLVGRLRAVGRGVVDYCRGRRGQAPDGV